MGGEMGPYVFMAAIVAVIAVLNGYLFVFVTGNWLSFGCAVALMIAAIQVIRKGRKEQHSDPG